MADDPSGSLHICPGCSGLVWPEEPWVAALELVENAPSRRVRFHEEHFAEALGDRRFKLLELHR
jgi:hypothetical protein